MLLGLGLAKPCETRETCTVFHHISPFIINRNVKADSYGMPPTTILLPSSRQWQGQCETGQVWQHQADDKEKIGVDYYITEVFDGASLDIA